MRYSEMKEIEIQKPKNCFFAFGDKQFTNALNNLNLDKKDIVSCGCGLYGTKEAINEYLEAIDQHNLDIANNCDPQEVYNYEFNDHECKFIRDDTDAIKIVYALFGDKANNVKRKFAVTPIDELFK